MADTIDIKNVPHSFGTSLEPTKIFNPLDEDFTWAFDGKPYTIPAKSTKEFPEFLARHIAKHLAQKIVYSNAYKEIEEKAKGQLTPDTAKAVPLDRFGKMFEWILNPVGVAPEKDVGQPILETKLEETLTEDEKIALEKYRKKVANLEKARAAKK